ncbi:hypothetical protein D3854_08220 [Streptococcus mutans]|jgi:hypothetical protein|uniref:hypothetical protein n=1 Tax=Streptococcus mutans TaxID=1309 RepID=UPI0002B560FD|nr:hypothetical protein [Streptococcus mutans]AMF86526.1 bacteriocin-type signal sequence [Streptococcus mutans]EMB64830.1 hypothetical protein SMU29_09618 [Streptococcus mutans 2ST1]EMC11016.1 hypothetical protein SMU75_06434 [Streptococcus mutans N3209]EMC34242.1 hypothetical protein SMU93_09373 [Streptococcus mutans 21]MCB4951884.1 hypothetical protein [Streptococcus mutans]
MLAGIEVEGGVNWERVFAGATVYGDATMAVCMATGPIGWGVGVAYLTTCAASGAYIMVWQPNLGIG